MSCLVPRETMVSGGSTKWRCRSMSRKFGTYKTVKAVAFRRMPLHPVKLLACRSEAKRERERQRETETERQTEREREGEREQVGYR